MPNTWLLFISIKHQRIVILDQNKEQLSFYFCIHVIILIILSILNYLTIRLVLRTMGMGELGKWEKVGVGMVGTRMCVVGFVIFII